MEVDVNIFFEACLANPNPLGIDDCIDWRRFIVVLTVVVLSLIDDPFFWLCVGRAVARLRLLIPRDIIFCELEGLEVKSW